MLTVLCGPAVAAPPIFGSQQAAPAKAKTSWSMPSLKGLLFGSQPSTPRSPAPPIAIQPPPAQQAPAQPFSAQRLRNALTQNPFADQVTNNRPSPAVTPSANPLSLDKEPGKLTSSILLPMAALAEQAGNIDAARQHYQKALASEPTNTKVLRQYGRLEDRQGRLAEAEKLYQQAVAANPSDSASLNDLALCYARQNKLQESVATLSQAIALRPEKALYRNNIAKVLVELGDTRTAAAQLTAAHGPVIAQYNLGTLLAASGKTAAAVSALEQAAAMDPSFEAARIALQQLRPAGAPAAATPHMAARENLPALASPAPAANEVELPTAAPTESLPTLPGAAPPAVAGPSFPRLLPPAVGQGR